jgi:nucleotide-binding universal stress UspA family protein
MKLFEHMPCDFYFLNVQKASSFISDDLMTISSSATIYTTLVDAAKKSIVNIISQIEKRHKNKNHTYHSIVDYDNFVDAINQTSEKHKIDLIVMGTKGTSGLNKVIFGSNTVHVMQRCNVPILAIPEGCKFKKLDAIALTSRHKSSYFIENLKSLKDLMLLYNSKLKILHVVEDYNFEEKLNENIEFFKENFSQVTFDRIVSDDENIYHGIHKYIIKNNIKMIAMISKKHPFLSRLFSRHSVETIASKIDIPFLVMHNS